jgi:CRP-like cAMP-binding protein
MADVRALKDQAARLFSQGRFDSAAAIYAELCELEPKDVQLRIRLGDARARAGDRAAAVEAYRSAAEDYARQGFLPRAIAACKSILEIEPGHEATQVALARLCTKRSSAGVPGPRRSAGAPPVFPIAGAAARPGDPGFDATSRTRQPSSAPETAGEAPSPFQFSELELGEAELVDLEAMAAKRAPEPSGAAAAGPTAPAAVRVRGWFASPEGAPLSLAELEIGQVDEAAEVELLTVAADRLPGAAELPDVPLFSELSREAFVELVSKCGLRRLAAGQTILEEGGVGTSFFAVSSGAVRVARKKDPGELVLARLGPGEFFGETALLSGRPRSASVVADEPTEVLEISAALLAGLLSRYPHVGQVLKRFCRGRLLANVLSTSRVFAPFAGEDRQRLFGRFQAREVEAGERILVEGQDSDGLYVVVSGTFEVLKAGADGPAKLAELREGDLFGEISLLTKGAATATVAAASSAALLRLPRQDFDELISTHPQILELVSELSDERLRAQGQRVPRGLTFV